jgi:arylsulfatase A-like enzyme
MIRFPTSPIRSLLAHIIASIAGSLFVVFAAAICHAAELPPRRPNILLVVADDMGYGDSTVFWKSTDLQTPAMEQIARQGIRFTQFRVNPQCSPTRSSLMTGQYSLENGMWRGANDANAPATASEKRDNIRRFKDDIVLLPQLLKAAGYATGCFGKWHLGNDEKNLPNARGFDEFMGFIGGSHAYRLGRNSKVFHNGKPFDAIGKHTTDLFADSATDFIKANKDRPFFCYVPFNAVHGPLRSADRNSDSAKPEWLEKYEKLGVPQPRRDYCAVMSHADARVGDMLNVLRDFGLESNTLVIYISDNGGILHTYPSNNGPLRGGKGETYEGGIRVPAVMQWPGVIPPNSVSRENAVHFDIFTTILSVAGVSVPAKNGVFPVHGINLLPLLRDPNHTKLPDRYLFWDLYGDVAALHGKWKMVGQISNHHGKFDKAAEEAATAKFELYNLEDDLGETTDLADRYPDIYQDLKSRHLTWLRQFAN